MDILSDEADWWTNLKHYIPLFVWNEMYHVKWQTSTSITHGNHGQSFQM